MKYLLYLFDVRRSLCDCGDIGCKREVKVKGNGTIYVVNHFTCGKVKKIINDYKDVRF